MISKTLLILFQMLQSDWLHYRFLFASIELLQIPPFDWLRYSLSIGDRPRTSSERNRFSNSGTMAENSGFSDVSIRFFN